MGGWQESNFGVFKLYLVLGPWGLIIAFWIPGSVSWKLIWVPNLVLEDWTLGFLKFVSFKLPSYLCLREVCGGKKIYLRFRYDLWVFGIWASKNYLILYLIKPDINLRVEPYEYIYPWGILCGPWASGKPLSFLCGLWASGSRC